MTSSMIMANQDHTTLSLQIRSLLLLLVWDKLERVAEYSEPGPLAPGPVPQELVAQRVAALAAQHLVGHHVLVLVGDGQQLPVIRLYLLGEAVSVHRAGEGGPRGVVLVLLRAGTHTNICK